MNLPEPAIERVLLFLVLANLMFHFWNEILAEYLESRHSGKIVFSTGCGGEMRELPKDYF